MTNKKQPLWEERGFSSNYHFQGWLYFNGLVHSSDGNDYVSVSENNEATQLFKEQE